MMMPSHLNDIRPSRHQADDNASACERWRLGHGWFRSIRRPGYQLYAPDTAEAEALLSERGLTRADLDDAIAELERTEGIQIRTIVGINEDGVFGSRRGGWRPDLPDACAEPFIPVLWIRVLELLGRVPKGSTAQFREDGTLPD